MKGCLLAPFKIIPFGFKLVGRFFLWCFTSGIKGFVVFGFVVVLAGFLLGRCSGHSDTVIQPLIEQGMPTKTEAPYYITTSKGEAYFVAAYHKQGTIVIMDTYWYVKSTTWVSSGGKAKALTDKDGKITVVRR